MVNVPVDYCVFMSAPNRGRALVLFAALRPLGFPAGKLGTFAGRVCGLWRCPVCPTMVL